MLNVSSFFDEIIMNGSGYFDQLNASKLQNLCRQLRFGSEK